MTDDSAVGPGYRGESPDLDEVLTLLSERYRRHALACLDGLPAPVALESLTDKVAGREFQQPPDKVSMLVRTQIATALHHNHLPALEDAGIIRYDSDEGEVTEIVVEEPLKGFLDKVRRHEG